jgi:hypothetical protein
LVFQDGIFLSTKSGCCVTGFSDKNHFAFHGSGPGFSLDLVVGFIGVDDWLLKTGAGFQNIRLCGCFIGSGFVQA